MQPITHVACRLNGVVWSLPKPFRHHHVLKMMFDHGTVWNDGDEKSQGFLDASGTYLTRREAEENAFANYQVKNGALIGGILTSEDLW